ncbi:MAG: MFS transporter [Bacteroidia bacterium]|nr:MFS transporter [Bacteroidia bacterium]
MKVLLAFFSHRSALAGGYLFFLLAVLFGNWVARIAEVKTSLGLTEGELGLAMIGLPAGIFLAILFSGAVLSRIPTGLAAWGSISLFALVVPFAGLAQDAPSLFVWLLLAGLTNGAGGVAVNTAVSAIEQRDGIQIIASCHGMFSIGGMAGALLGGLQVQAGLSLFGGMMLTALVMVLSAALLFHREYQGMPNEAGAGGGFELPGRSLLILALIGLCIMTGEGAIADWSAVLLRDYLGAGESSAGLAYAGFSLAMTAGRFSGDTLIARFGSRQISVGGALLGAAGMLAAVLAATPGQAIAGFTLAGLGYSCVVPIVFRAAANTPGVPASRGIAAVTSIGFLGFMGGPPLLGLIGDQLGLRMALSLMVALALLAAALLRRH